MNRSAFEQLLNEADQEGSALNPSANWPAFLKNTALQITQIPLPICVLWGKERALLYNQAFKDQILQQATYHIGMPYKKVTEPFWDHITPYFEQALEGNDFSIEDLLVSNDEKQGNKYFNITINALSDENGLNAAIMLTFTDATAKVRCEQAPQNSEENLHATIRHAPVAMAALRGKDLVVQIANDKVCDMWGRTYEECIGKPIFDIIPEVRDQGFEELVQRVINSGESIEVKEMPVMKLHEGRLQERYMTFSYEPIKDSKGHIDGIVTVGLDVTDSVQLKKLITQAEERTKIAVEAAAIGIFELTLANDEIITSARFDEIFGVAASTVHEDYFKVIHPDDVGEWRQTVQDALMTGKLYQQYRVLKEDGTICWIQMLGRVFYHENGEPERVFGTAIDVTLQVQAKQKLLEDQQHAQLLLNSIPIIAWTNDLSGNVTFYNQRWYDYTGLTFEQTKAWGWKEVIHPDDLQYNLDAYAKILAGKVGGTFEIREKDRDGTYRWHLVNIEPITDATGNIIQWIGTATDVQRLKELERQKDEFISIASHELKTPLTSVKAFNQIMLKTENTLSLKDLAVKSKDHIGRLEKLIGDLLDVSRISAGKLVYDMQDVDLEKILTESIESVQMTTQKHEIAMKGCGQVMFYGNPNRLEQVMNNLLNNAVKYSPDGGTITVTCDVDDSGIVVAVRDQGIGIEKQHLSKLFDRYYRIDNTAMRFSGLGLGLYITSEIIKRHKGSLWIESEPGEGATFYFRLPLAHTATVEADEDALYKDNWITITYDQAEPWVKCAWHGYQNIHSIKRSCLRLLEMATTFKVSKILADNTYVEGTWTDATDWVGKEFYPMMDSAGIRQLAWIHSKSAFSQLAAEKTVDIAIGKVVTRFFDSIESAQLWLSDDI